ncbi:asialoglycoprotein receptor 1-like [Onychostoma macrolepis]|uniref:C-type lectin domain-containing protein n=1 Tax=Onychostoma macrolepis TaxID=369639 RepID=A0A7J6CNL8_9TELE|nr:asialoglycoprotein receptor 1-like [Onychostoma macrolepis]KAF4108165.1 hypothetical protein G5714_010924 [Onychostoma macrolepis]
MKTNFTIKNILSAVLVSHVLNHTEMSLKKKKPKSRSSELCRTLDSVTSNNFMFNSSRLDMSYYGNMNIPGTRGMAGDKEEMNIYANADVNDVRTETENTKRHQTPQHTESSRAAAVCLVLLCVLLLTAVIVLSVHIHTNNTNYTEKRNELLTRNTNLTEEREQLLTTIEALKDQQAIKNEDFTAEKRELLSKNDNLMKQSEQLNQENNDLRKRLGEMEKWKCYQSSLYYLSSERKSWAESRRYCTERGADLIIINNREEQEFVRKWSDKYRVWIGLTDSDVEDSWKWVDGSTPTSGFWMSTEPNGYRGENCVLTVVGEWADYPCTEEFNWMCERSTV